MDESNPWTSLNSSSELQSQFTAVTLNGLAPEYLPEPFVSRLHRTHQTIVYDRHKPTVPSVKLSVSSRSCSVSGSPIDWNVLP